MYIYYAANVNLSRLPLSVIHFCMLIALIVLGDFCGRLCIAADVRSVTALNSSNDRELHVSGELSKKILVNE